jgi:hypothetical protein
VDSSTLLSDVYKASQDSHSLPELVTNLANRYLNVSGLDKAQSFFDQQVSLANRILAPYQKSAEPMLKWIKSSRGRCELYMYKRSQIRDKFSRLVARPIEFLVVVQNIVLAFFKSRLRISRVQRCGRAQIMSIRGLALSCAPNFSRISDINPVAHVREFA